MVCSCRKAKTAELWEPGDQRDARGVGRHADRLREREATGRAYHCVMRLGPEWAKKDHVGDEQHGVEGGFCGLSFLHFEAME